MKLKKLIPNKKSLNECVIATLHIDGETILAKNRDRKYDPTVKVVHELKDGVEIIYIQDTITDWSEGMNEFGIGVINASLMVHFDEMEGDLAKDKDKKGVTPSYDGMKIREALSKNKLSETIKSIIYFKGKDKKDVGVKGMTMVASPKHSYIIELTSEHEPIIKQTDKNKVVVRTNHGIEHPDTGYTSGIKRQSSVSRKEIATKELEQVKNPATILDVLANQWTDENFMNPYRRDNKFDMQTTGQVMMNLDQLKFSFRWNTNHSKFEGYENKLPKDYKPKIEVEFLDPVPTKKEIKKDLKGQND